MHFFQSCFDEGVDYFGNDLADGQFDSTSSAAECQTHCQQTQGCNFWTWDPGYNNACWKKSAKGPIQTNARLTSGPKTCGGSNPTTVPPNSTPGPTTAPPNDNPGSGCHAVNIFGNEPLTSSAPPFHSMAHTSPPGRLFADTLKTKPLPTNAWWENLALGSGSSRINILPYQVKAEDDVLELCYPKKIVTSTYVLTGFLGNLIFGASEGLVSRQVVDFDELSATVK